MVTAEIGGVRRYKQWRLPNFISPPFAFSFQHFVSQHAFLQQSEGKETSDGQHHTTKVNSFQQCSSIKSR
jgi:hypothetical protein